MKVGNGKSKGDMSECREEEMKAEEEMIDKLHFSFFRPGIGLSGAACSLLAYGNITHSQIQLWMWHESEQREWGRDGGG